MRFLVRRKSQSSGQAQPALHGGLFDESRPNATYRRVAKPWTARELLERRAAAEADAWADGDELTFVYQGTAEAVDLAGGLHLPMERVPGGDLWALTVRVADLQRAVISYMFLPRGVAGPPAFFTPTEWRGPDAPPATRRSHPLRGEIATHTIASAALGEDRKLTVYLPPGHGTARPSAVVYAADGEAVPAFASMLEPVLLDGSLPPVALVGLHSGPAGGTRAAGNPVVDLRAQEYLTGHDDRRFAAHERFFVSEVVPWAEAQFAVATNPARRAVFGFSNGGAFATTMGVRHPALFGSILAFSVAGGKPASRLKPPLSRFYFVAGTLEPGLRENTLTWKQTLDQAGAECSYHERVCGHDFILWQETFPGAVAWAFAR
jgi:enterochelin esterase-like enzyme